MYLIRVALIARICKDKLISVPKFESLLIDELRKFVMSNELYKSLKVSHPSVIETFIAPVSCLFTVLRVKSIVSSLLLRSVLSLSSFFPRHL